MGKIICSNLYNVILRLPKVAEESNIDKILRSLRPSLRSGLRSLRMTRRLLRLLAMTVCLVFLSVTNSFAEVYITADEAMRKIFPSLEKYEEQTRMFDGQEVKVFTVTKQGGILGWAVALDEMGKVKPITFLVGIDNQGKVLDVYLLEYRDLFGSGIKRRSFLKQFRNKTSDDKLAAGKDIDAVTGATISSKAAATAVKKALKVVLGKENMI